MSPAGSSKTGSLLNRRILPALSIVTVQEADLDDEQIRALLASPLYLPEREASAERSQVHHSEKRRLDVQFISGAELHRHKEVCCIVFTSEKV